MIIKFELLYIYIYIIMRSINASQRRQRFKVGSQAQTQAGHVEPGGLTPEQREQAKITQENADSCMPVFLACSAHCETTYPPSSSEAALKCKVPVCYRMLGECTHHSTITQRPIRSDEERNKIATDMISNIASRQAQQAMEWIASPDDDEDKK